MKIKGEPIDYDRALQNFDNKEMFVQILRDLERSTLDYYAGLLFEDILKMNYKDIKFHAYCLKGPLVYVCADETREKAMELEKAALAQDDREIVVKYLELLEMIREIKRYLDTLPFNRFANFEIIDKYETGIRKKYHMIIEDQISLEGIDKGRSPACCGSCNLF